MQKDEWLKMMQELYSYKKKQDSHVILRYWDISGQLVCKHYKKNEGVNTYVIYPN